MLICFLKEVTEVKYTSHCFKSVSYSQDEEVQIRSLYVYIHCSTESHLYPQTEGTMHEKDFFYYPQPNDSFHSDLKKLPSKGT